MKRVAWLLAAIFCLGTVSGRAADATVTVVQQPDSTSEVIGVEVSLQGGLDRQNSRQNGLAALVAEAILQTPVTGGTALRDAISASGGSITFNVEPHEVRFYLEGLSGSFASVLDAFHAALVKPDFGDKTLDAARAVLVQRLAQTERTPLDVGINMLNRAFYQNSEAGMPPLGMAATLATLRSSDARAFYAAYYRHDDAVVSAVGDVNGLPAGTYAALVTGLPPGVSAPVVVNIPKLPSATHQFIARRDVSVPWLVAQYAAPDLRSKDFGAMLILTAFVERTLADVSVPPGVVTDSAAQRGVGAYYNFDTRPANVIVYVDGGLGDPARAFATALSVVDVLGHAKLSGNLSEMKTFAIGRFLEDTTTLQDRAWLNAVFASRGLHGDYAALARKAIESTTAAQLQHVAAHYLAAPTIALVLPRSQDAVDATP